MSTHRSMRWKSVATAGGLAAPSVAWASDFTGLLYLLIGVTVVVAVGLTFLASHLSRRTYTSGRARAVIWGTWMAVMFTPYSVDSGHGRYVPALFGLVVSGLGGPMWDTLRLFGVLLLSIPTSIAGILFIRWLWRVVPPLDLDK